MISPIAISTVHGKNLAVMLASIREYCPEIPVYLRGPASVLERFDADVKMIGQPRNFGDDYNDIINCALKDFDSVVVANDDIVLTPSSYRVLMDDVDIVNDLSLNPGWVAARCDSARAVQNIRWNPEGEALICAGLRQSPRFAAQMSSRPYLPGFVQMLLRNAHSPL